MNCSRCGLPIEGVLYGATAVHAQCPTASAMNHGRYREHRIRGSLERHVGDQGPDERELRALAAKAWHQNGTAVVFRDQVNNWRDRALIEAIATRLYGPRAKASQ